MALSPLHQLADDLLFEMMKESPDLSAHMGVRDVAGRAIPQDTVTDFSPAGVARRDAVIDSTAKRLSRIDRAKLNANDQLTFDVIDYVTREGLFWIYRGTNGRAFP